MNTKTIQKDDFIESVFGNGYVLKNDKKNEQVIISSKGTMFESLFDSVTISYKYIKNIKSKYFYKIRYQNDLQGDDVVDLDYDSLATARKEFKKLCKRKDVYDIVLMKYLRKTNEWIDDIDW